jgi:hypothetical protein
MSFIVATMPIVGSPAFGVLSFFIYWKHLDNQSLSASESNGEHSQGLISL